MTIYFTLYYEFLKVGLFTIGGGLAALPFLQKLVDQYGWITSDQLLDMIAISESTPGPIGINAATFMGYKVAGVLGGVIATLGVVTPSLIIIVLLAHTLKNHGDHPLVQGGFSTIRPAVAGLIGSVAIQLGRDELFHLGNWVESNLIGVLNFPALGVFALIFYLIHRLKWHPVACLAGAAFIGIIFRL